ncbi:MAG: 1,2-phenylacetyl-CoA epoxidase subunit PaaD [Pseudomonadota bacterium]|nr:1,2-phenylacetyl-CoA epoxidase subunit PaaD [Pseudomonadota bacterium]
MVVACDIDRDIGRADVLADIRRIAESVPDPELVVVNVGDLGIIRDLRQDGDRVEIDVTPTYSACPATLAIELAIETAVAAAGHEVRVRRVLAPAWTTDWITPAGRAKLKQAGIAPPSPRGDGTGGQDSGDQDYFTRPQVACPRCDSLDTAELSAFGATACKAQYRCLSCREPFDYFKCL